VSRRPRVKARQWVDRAGRTGRHGRWPAERRCRRGRRLAVFLSEGTVRNYLSSAIAKTAARNRVEALRTAEAQGWL